MLLIITFIAACKSNTKHGNVDSVAVGSINSSSQVLISQFKPFIQGVWVKSDYIEKILATKSPLAAQDLASGLTTFNIQTDSIKGDSVKVAAGWNNHEGSELTLKFQQGKTEQTILLGDFDLGYSIKNGDTTLVLYGYDKDKNEHTTTRYTKALNKQNGLSDGMDFLINRGLIAGNYTLNNIPGNRGAITFTNDGKVTGLADFKTYALNTDFVAGPENNLDEILFNLYSKAQKSFTFKINKDTLNIFDTRESADSINLIVDKLEYKLIKQK
ncbi:hypothetical protein [Mucilaginibacter xinganensis]|uniref:Uncharacterized protein n=1 Tax=Mucilaginibacter xinganensis TaxID=1234841 RepID=A0A223NRI6_9SPHI|nr:hypothetical protein [Mucilaginibacter xinganensis]ASU32091.1 hypothetical protein MuYL_0188 [Mucilaginibacter xinganensis]